MAEIRTGWTDAEKRDLEVAKLLADTRKSEIERDRLEYAAEQERASAEIRRAKERQDLRKAEADADKSERERDRLVAEAEELSARRRKAATEQAKLDLDARNARWSPWFETAKAIVPALSIVASVLLAMATLDAQHVKDSRQRDLEQAIAVTKQVSEFNVQMSNPDGKVKQIAVGAVRSLGGHAVPTLLANLDVDQATQVHSAIAAAVADISTDPKVREQVLAALLDSIKSVSLRRLGRDKSVDSPNLARYLILWNEAIGRFKEVDPIGAKPWSDRADQLLAGLKAQIARRAAQDRVQDIIKDIDAAYKQELPQ